MEPIAQEHSNKSEPNFAWAGVCGISRLNSIEGKVLVKIRLYVSPSLSSNSTRYISRRQSETGCSVFYFFRQDPFNWTLKRWIPNRSPYHRKDSGGLSGASQICPAKNWPNLTALHRVFSVPALWASVFYGSPLVNLNLVDEGKGEDTIGLISLDSKTYFRRRQINLASLPAILKFINFMNSSDPWPKWVVCIEHLQPKEWAAWIADLPVTLMIDGDWLSRRPLPNLTSCDRVVLCYSKVVALDANLPTSGYGACSFYRTHVA